MQSRSSYALALPYWDMALDADLPDPKDSVVWCNSFFGTPVGPVTEGMGKHWKVTSECTGPGDRLRRNVSGNPDFLFSRKKIASIFSAKNLYELMGTLPQMPVSQFELDHGLVHCYAGGCLPQGCVGHLGCVSCSPNDPIFWLIHGFVDLLWEEWSQLPGRDNTYPEPGKNGATQEGIGGPDYLKNAPMKPFPNLINNHGLRQNYYTGYTTRPSKLTCNFDSQCRSPLGLLFCHRYVLNSSL